MKKWRGRKFRISKVDSLTLASLQLLQKSEISNQNHSYDNSNNITYTVLTDIEDDFVELDELTQ